jgi:translation elongation factor EF-G
LPTGDLNSRRAQIIQRQDMRRNANVITAMVPLANMAGYVNVLRSMSQGRATFTMHFDHYAPVPLSEDDEQTINFYETGSAILRANTPKRKVRAARLAAALGVTAEELMLQVSSQRGDGHPFQFGRDLS